MKVAAIYDIHGNVPALEAVLKEVHDEGVDEILVGGDVVPGPLPGEALAMVLDLSLPVRFIHGNGEQAVLAAHRGEPIEGVPERMHETIRWVAEQLSREQLAAIDAWPLTTAFALEGAGEVLACHATPRNDTEIFTRLTPEERLRPAFDGVRADIVVCGHTHMPFDRRIGEVRVVNAGSVGMPWGEPGAYWLLLGAGGPHPRRTEYDLEDAAERLAVPGYPAAALYDVRTPPSEAQMVEAFEKVALQ
jgi:putative phosphoesterase